jgi:hypothetical protein
MARERQGSARVKLMMWAQGYGLRVRQMWGTRIGLVNP